MSAPKAVSLFSGVGMFDLGVSLAGFDIIAQVEINDFCRKVLSRHAPEYWPNATQFVDVREFGRHSVNGPVDLIYGGFPCQPHSLAGSRKGEADDRNLWPEFERIIGEFRPGAVMLENVPGITQASTLAGELRPAYALTVIADLAEMGYVCRWGLISAADAGAPHVRDRWWCVAYASGERLAEPSAGYDSPHDGGDNPARQLRWGSVVHASVTGGEDSVMVNANSAGLPESSSATRAKRAGLRRKSKPAGRSGKKHGAQSRMGRAANGASGGVDSPRWPAYQNQSQHAWEASRTIDKTASPYRRQRLQALGNGGIWWIAHQIAAGIAERLET